MFDAEGVTGVYSGGLWRDCKPCDFIYLTVQPSHVLANFCWKLSALFSAFVSPVRKTQNDALTKVIIIGKEQIIKSLVNADCCLGLCLTIPNLSL